MPVPTHHQKTQRALHQFSRWVHVGMKPAVANVVLLANTNPAGLTNPILRFVVPRALANVVERYAVEVVQAWELTNKELKRHGMRTLGVSNKDFRHLKKIRNKLVAHKIENNVRTSRYESWYRKTYGSYATVLALIERVATRTVDGIRRLEHKGLLGAHSYSLPSVPEIKQADIDALLAALRKEGIY